jgi:D-cysteine desulfhydrase
VTPIVPLNGLSSHLWIKRDDLFADPIGGNKVRALEYLFGDLKKGDDVVTVGSAGSTHALSVATYGGRLGARVHVGRWTQEMNQAAERVSGGISRRTLESPVFRTPVAAFAWAWLQRARGARWIAAGGSTPLGILGHVNAGLELVDQIDSRVVPEPRYVVVPLGTGGTAAGLALAFAIAERPITVVGARVVPWIVARRSRVESLARKTAQLIERVTKTSVPRIPRNQLVIHDDTYGGAYGRETDAGRTAAAKLRAAHRIDLDATYSAKAFSHALALASRDPTLFWLTFDSRTLASQ